MKGPSTTFGYISPGVANSVKPEACAPAGSLAFDVSTNTVVTDAELSILTAGGTTPDRVLEVDIGTSFAAPVMTRVIAGIANRYPNFGPNLLRALALQGTGEWDFESNLLGDTPAKRREAARHLLGYGSVRLAEAIESTDYRAVLIAEEEIPVDGVHIYELPIPQSFFESGGVRGIDVALSYDPYVRPRRLDYLSSKMDFHLVRGMTPDEVEEVFLSMEEAEAEAAEETAQSDEAEEGEEETSGDVTPPTPSKLGRNLLSLSPSPTIRSRGANQVGRIKFKQKLKEEDGDTFLLVIRNTNRWADVDSMQTYALAVAISRDEDHDALYADLQVRLEIPVEVEIRS